MRTDGGLASNHSSDIPKDMSLAASPVDGKTYFLFGSKGSGWYDIDSASAPSDKPVDTTSPFHTLPALNIDVPRAANFNGSIYIFGKVSFFLECHMVSQSIAKDKRNVHALRSRYLYLSLS